MRRNPVLAVCEVNLVHTESETLLAKWFSVAFRCHSEFIKHLQAKENVSLSPD